MSMKEFKNRMAKMVFGMTIDEAHEKDVCISCKKPMKDMNLSELDKSEYRISGLCPKCFANSVA